MAGSKRVIAWSPQEVGPSSTGFVNGSSRGNPLGEMADEDITTGHRLGREGIEDPSTPNMPLSSAFPFPATFVHTSTNANSTSKSHAWLTHLVLLFSWPSHPVHAAGWTCEYKAWDLYLRRKMRSGCNVPTIVGYSPSWERCVRERIHSNIVATLRPVWAEWARESETIL
jgi:hypothetical protein